MSYLYPTESFQLMSLPQKGSSIISLKDKQVYRRPVPILTLREMFTVSLYRKKQLNTDNM